MSLRLPPPLACAVVLAAAIALRGTSAPTLPEGALADDRTDERIVGVIGGPLVHGPHGIGAPLHAGRTTVWIWTEHAIRPGDRVAVTGRLRSPRGALAPGASDRAALVASRGAEWELTTRQLDVLGVEDDARSTIWRWADGVQRAWSARVPADEPAGAALRGIVTGDRARVPEDLDHRWRAVGIYHVLSVSGLHLAVVAGLLFALLRRLVAASPWGGRVHPARWAAPLAIVLAVTYTLITGAQLATLRALVVVVIVLVAQMLDRPVRLVDALGAAAIAILVWRPQDLHDPSFQLSFVAALTLALRPRVVPSGNRVLHWLARGLATSAWVVVTTAPLTAYHFHQVAVGGLLGNLLLTPLLELVALPLGLAGVVLGDAGTPLVSLAVALVDIVDRTAGLIARGTPIGTIAISSALVMAALVALSLWLAARPRQRTRTDLIAWLALCAAWTQARATPPIGALRITFVDVAQGDAAIVELPDGTVWLVDAGGAPNARTLTAAAAPGRTIARTLQAYGHHAIDLAIVSHPHPDHYLGLVALAGTVPIRELWFADLTPSTSNLPDLPAIAEQLAAHGTRLAQPHLGTLRSASGVELDVWAPRYRASDDAAEQLAADPVRSVNDNSLVVAIRHAGRTILFTGDVETEGEELLVAAGIGSVDVVKVAHHGSRTSSSAAFVDTTRPELAVISCGVANAFGFPAPGVIERWRRSGAQIERTDTGGSITVTVAANGDLRVERFRRSSP